MAPKVENKQGRSIFRAIIIFCPRLQDFVDCSIMRLRAFCGDDTTILGYFTHKARKNHMLGKRMHWIFCILCCARILFDVHLFWFEQRKIFFIISGVTTWFCMRGANHRFSYRQDQAQRQGWRCCQSSSEGCRRTLTQSKISPLLEFSSCTKSYRYFQAHKARKVRTSTTFHRPKTLQLSRSPKYPRKSVTHGPRLDYGKVILYPLNTESAMKKIEENNTLVFIVDVKSNKRQVKMALKKLYDVDTVKVNSLVRYGNSAHNSCWFKWLFRIGNLCLTRISLIGPTVPRRSTHG